MSSGGRIQITYGKHRPIKESPAGKAAQYLKEREDIPSAVGIATGALYAPVQIALEGGSVEEVEQALAIASMTWTEYRVAALQLVGASTHKEIVEEPNQNIELGESF